MKARLMHFVCPCEQSMIERRWEAVRETGTWTKTTLGWGMVLISPNTDRSSLVRQPRQEAKLNLKVILVGKRRPFAFKYVWPTRQQGPALSDGLAVIASYYKYLFRLFFFFSQVAHEDTSKSLSFKTGKLQTKPDEQNMCLTFSFTNASWRAYQLT